MVVLDTDFLIDVMHEDAVAVQELEQLLTSYEPVTLSAITVMQLHHGVARSSKPSQERRRIQDALQGAVVYPIDQRVAATAGELDGSLVQEGSRIGPADTLIAATALHHGESVLTGNVRNFERIEGLEVRPYR